MTQTSIVTGVNGQIGSYLTEFLLEKGYKVYGLKRRSSSLNTERIDHLYQDPHEKSNLELVYGDLSDYGSLVSLVGDIKPDLFFGIAAQSHVKTSFDIPEYTMDIVGTGVLRCLEAIRKTSPETKFLQSSSSVSGDTKVLVKLDGETKLIEIQNLVKSNDEKTNYDNLECLTVDNDYNTKYSKVAYVFKHKSNNLYKIRGSGGLDIDITGDHSVVVFDNECNLIEKKVENLSKDDLLISFNNFDHEKKYPEFDLSNHATRYQKEFNLKSKRYNPRVDKLIINDDLMRLIGYYLAEGNIFYRESKWDYNVTFTFHIKEKYYTDDIIKILKNNFGENFSVSEQEKSQTNTRKLKFSSKQLVMFLLEHFKTGSHKKIIPSWMYDLPKSAFIEFLRGYIGDARINKNDIRYTSVNQNLIENICYLAKLNGLDCNISKRFNKAHLSPQKTIIKDSWCYDLIFNGKNADLIKNFNQKDRSKFKNLNSELVDSKIVKNLNKKAFNKLCRCKKSISKQRLLEYGVTGKLEQLCKSNLHIVRIKEIKKLDRDEYVYDLHVPETQRFIGGNYPILLHNSEMYGSHPPPQNELTPFKPCSPYAVAKVAGYYATINYREAYNLFAVNSICFNFESPRRLETFVTRKITRAATRIKEGLQDKLYLGNLEAKRDWQHAKDAARAMYTILTADKPDDFVIASGESRSVKEFVEIVFSKLGLDWKEYVIIDPRYFRPSEVDALCGDATKIRETLGFKHEYNFEMLVNEMIENDLRLAKQEKLIKNEK